MNSKPDVEAIGKAIREKYERVAATAEGKFNYATGEEGARAMGYDEEIVASAPKGLLQSFCGVGNPFALGEIAAGESVLDVGCGAGFDLFVASWLVGSSGRVSGIDLTAAMVAAARRNMAAAELGGVDVREGSAEALPFADSSMDVVLSNGVLNLAPRKERSMEEIWRVLRPGGRLQFADVVVEDALPKEVVGSLEAWSD